MSDKMLCTICDETYYKSEVPIAKKSPVEHVYECPDCEAHKFRPIEAKREPPQQTADQRREQKRRQKVRSLSRTR